MGQLLRHWPRIAVTLLPLVFALLHAVGVVRLGVLERLDNIIYDTRLRATMPGTLDDRVVIVDIDEKSLAEVGRWPWGRNRLAELTDDEKRQQADKLGKAMGNPMAKMAPQAADFGGMAVYLASDASSFHTGDSFLIDGGYAIF